MSTLVLPLAPRERARRLFARGPADPNRPAGVSGGRTGKVPAGAPLTGERAGFVMLIVDDDPLMTDMLPRRLRRVIRSDVDIRTATTVEEASEIIRSVRPDAVLSDYNLRQDKNGIDVLRVAEEVAPKAARILFSGHSAREIRGLPDATIHAYVEKPMKLDELITPVLDAIARATGDDLRGGATRA